MNKTLVKIYPCVYCDQPAETWDHIMAVVKGGKFSGDEHQVGNLIPCCTNCNSKKDNRDWEMFLIAKRPNEASSTDLINKIEAYISKNTIQFGDLLDEDINNEIEKFKRIEEEVYNLLKLVTCRPKLFVIN